MTPSSLAEAGTDALTEAEANSPLGDVPYDLRRSCVSAWLNASIPTPRVVEWAGHSVNVPLNVHQVHPRPAERG